jgi:hypothetical protein
MADWQYCRRVDVVEGRKKGSSFLVVIISLQIQTEILFSSLRDLLKVEEEEVVPIPSPHQSINKLNNDVALFALTR